MAVNRNKGNSHGKYRLSGSKRSYAARNRRRTKKTTWNFPLIALILVIFISMITLIVWGAKKIVSSFASDNSILVQERLNRIVTIDGINIQGMTEQEAKDTLKSNYPWSMTVKLEGAEEDTIEIPNLSDKTIDALIHSIFSSETEPLETYTLAFTIQEHEIKKQVEEMALKWNIQPRNGSISGFDKTTGSFTYSGERTGREVDQERLLQDIKSAVETKEFTKQIPVIAKDVVPEITEAQAKEMYQVIGTFTTKTTANADRNTNIKIACEAMDGMIIQSGEEFSFNNTTGNRTVEKGYKPAGAYLNGVLIEEPGGGVCQVSSTLYNAVVRSGLTTTERHAHTFEPSYVNAGEDAMVSYDGYAGPDMKFLNISHAAVAIRARFSDQTLTLSIIGIPVLDDGVEIGMHSEKTNEYDPPEPDYVDDVNLSLGREVLVEAATKGSRWVTNLVTKKNGEVVKEVFLHNSVYKGHPATIKKNPNSQPKDTSMAVKDGSSSATTGENSANSSTTANENNTVTRATTVGNDANESSAVTGTSKANTTVPASTTARETIQGPGSTGTTSVPTTARETEAQGPGDIPTTANDGGGAELIPPNPGGTEPIGPGGSS